MLIYFKQKIEKFKQKNIYLKSWFLIIFYIIKILAILYKIKLI
jgi:hypothetical protein